MEWHHNAVWASLAVVGLMSGFAAAEERASDQSDSLRSAAGLQAFYDFSSTEGDLVRDRSGIGEPLDLIIEKPQAVRRSEGMLEVREPTLPTREEKRSLAGSRPHEDARGRLFS